MKSIHSSGIICRFRRKANIIKPLIATITAYCFFFTNIAFAQVTKDGKTNTDIVTAGNITNITTATIHNNNAYNSFSAFDVDQGNVVNLIVPDAANALINLINSDTSSSINGTLNSIKGGRIGGNVFLVNPYGFVIGAGGAVNVGSLTVVTPTRTFMDDYFDLFGGISVSEETMLLNGTAPVSGSGNIVIQGKVNAITDIKLIGGNVTNSGVIASGAVFGWDDDVNFSDVVNTGGLESGSNISIENGDIYIRAETDVENSGTIKTDLDNSIAAGNVEISAGNEIRMMADSTISTRNLSDTDNNLTAVSQGDSGNITLNAPQITLNTGSSLLAHIINDQDAQGNDITDYNAGNITLTATDEDGYIPVVDIRNSTAKITLNSSTLKGNDIKLEATATSSMTFDDDGTPTNGIVNWLDGLSILGGVAISNADAEVLINGTSNIEGSTLTLDATAQANATVNTISSALGFAYGESNPTAKVIVGDGVNAVVINTTGDVKLNSKAESYVDVNAYTVYLGKKEGSPIDVTFAYGESTINSTAQISENVDAGKTGGSGNIGGSLKVEADVVKHQNVSSLSGAYEDGSLGGAAAVSLSTGNANAFIDGAVNAADEVSVIADSYAPKNDTSASTEAGSGLVSGVMVKAVNGLWGLFQGKSKNANSKSGLSSKIKLSGAVAYADHDTNATARIGDSANVTSQLSATSAEVADGVLIKSTVTDIPEIAAISMVDSDTIDKNGGNTSENSVSAAVLIGDYTNNANAYIGKNAVVNARIPITITSKTLIPWSIQWDDYDDVSSLILDKLNPNLGIQNGFFTSWAQSVAQGTKTALAGAVNILDINNTSNAYIDEGAKINQDAGFRSGLQDVRVMASNEIETLNLSGLISLGSLYGNIKDLFSLISNGKIKPNMNKPGTAGVGGSYLDVSYTNNVKAEIKSGAQIYADSLQVEADSTTSNISIAEAGGKAGDYAINGTFSLLNTTDTTIAKIDDGASVTTGDDVIAGDTEGNNVLVKAKNEARIYNISGGISKAENVSVGLSVSINEITRDTEALIGNLDGESDDPGGSLASDGKVEIAASNEGLISSWSLAGAIASGSGQYQWPEEGVNTQSDEGKKKLAAFLDSRMKNSKQSSGLGISGDVSVNLMYDTAAAYIKDAHITKAAGLELESQNNSEIDALAGSATYTNSTGSSVGLAGSVTWNELKNKTKSYIDNSTLENMGDLDLTADSTGAVKTIAASGSGAVNSGGSGIGVAGSLSYNYIDNETLSYINNSDVTSDQLLASDISISALDDSTIWSIAGAGSYGGKAGFGVSIAVNMMDNTTEAYAKDSDLSATGDILISAGEESEIKTVTAAIGVAKEGMAVAASASGNDLSNTTKAYISGKKEDGITADGNVSLAANDDADILSIAGNISADLKGGGGLGASASVIVTNNTVESYIGTGSTVTAKGEGDGIAVYTGEKSDDGTKKTETMKGVSVTATSYEDILSVAAGGSGAEKLAVQGSATVHVLNENTYAHIDGGAEVTAGALNNTTGVLEGTEQDINVLASDRTDITGIAGAATISMNGGIGAGADVGVITKNTNAYIANNAEADATKDVKIQASSLEDINSIAGTVSLSKSWSFGGAASVYSIDNKTKAFIEGGDTSATSVHADGSVLVSADNDTEIDSIAGTITFGASAGIGASATTAIITKTTEAFIGKNADVKADGERDAIDVATGRFIVQTVDNSGDEYGVDTSDTENLNLNADVDTSAISSSQTKKLKGLAVTAVSKDDISSISASGGGSGNVAVNLAGAVNMVSNNTSAHIDEGAKINVNEDNASVGDNQAVLVAAGTDFRHTGISAAAAISGNVGMGPAAEVTVVDNNTYAYIGKSAKVNAEEDIEVIADSVQDILSITGAGALGVGAVGLAGSVSVISIDNETFAYVGDGTGTENAAAINADGNIVISAKDNTETDIISGSLAGGTVGIGGAVGVTLIEKDTKAYTGNYSVVNAGGNSANTISTYSGQTDDEGNPIEKTVKGLSVQASSSEDFSTITGAFAGGYAGLAGAVVVNTIESDTSAYIGDSARVNKDQIAADVNGIQDVNVSAVNDVNDFSVSGSLALGGVGISGGLGFHTINNNTSAYLGNGADVTAEQDVALNAFSNKETETYAVSAAGGIVGVAGGVTVLTIGTTPDNSSTDSLSSKGGNGGYEDPSDYAESQAQYDFIGDSLDDSYGMDEIKTSAADAVSSVTLSPTTVSEGTSAFIGSSATVNAGKDIQIDAEERIDVDNSSGAAAGGLASLGGGVGIANVRSQVRAYIDDDEAGLASSINATGNITIMAELNEKALNNSYAGGLSAFLGVSGAVSYIDNDYLVDAHIGKDVTIDNADTISVTAKTDTNDKSESLEGAVAGILGVGVSYAEVDSDGTTRAYVDDGANIGKSDDEAKQVNNLSVTADSSNVAYTGSAHLSGGILAGGYNEADSGISPTVTAYIGSDAAIDLQQDLTVASLAAVDSTAKTWGGNFGGVSIGVGVAEATVTPTVKAYINGGDLSDIDAKGDILIKAYGNYDLDGEKAKVDRDGDDATDDVPVTVWAENDATAGSLILSYNNPSATAKSVWTVDAYIGEDADIESDGDLAVDAMSYSGQVYSDVDANAYGAAALGSNESTATITNTVNSHIGQDSSVKAASIDVSAMGISDAYAKTSGGSGGILTSASASSNTNVTNTVSAYLVGNKDTSAKIESDKDINVYALSDITFNASSSSLGIGILVGNNAARLNNVILSNAKAYIGTDANVESADDILVKASNKVLKPNIGANLYAGAGGFWGGPSGDSVTTITDKAQAYIAGNSSADKTDKIKAGNDITVSAANDISAYDKATLTAGGVIAVADVHSTITNSNTSETYVGNNAVIEAVNDVNVYSSTDANIEAVTYTEGFGVGASADGKAEVTVTADNDTNINANADISAGNDINVFAGKGDDGLQNNLRARAEARSFSAGGIPLSSLTANAFLNDYNDIIISGGSNLKAGSDINVGALTGTTFREAYARAKLRTYALFGIPITWYSNGTRGGQPLSGNTVTINGTLESGQNHEKVLHINADGTVNSDSNITPTFTENVDGAAELQARIDELNALIASDNTGKSEDIILAQEVARYQEKLDQINEGRETDPTYGYYDRYSLEDIAVGSGDINITGTLSGSGTLKVPGNDFLIEIQNYSLAYLELNKLEIPDDLSGRITLNNRTITSYGSLNIDPGKNIGKRIVVENLYDPYAPGSNEDAFSDIVLKGDIINRDGTIDIYNESGSIESLGDVTGDEVSIYAAQEFAQSYTPGLWEVGSNPLISGGGINISGEVLNINGTIQSGTPYRTVTIEEFDPENLVAAEDGKKYIPTTGDSNIKAVWDEENQCIQLYSVKVTGGNITLSGEIVSTGGGALKVIDGYGEIHVANNSSQDIVINKLDTGNRISGKIKITDTGKLDGDGNPLVTEITRSNGNVNVLQYRIQLDDDNKLTVVDNSLYNYPSIEGRTTQYLPREGARVFAIGEDYVLTNNKSLNFMENLLLSLLGTECDSPIDVEFLGSDRSSISINNAGAGNILLNNNIVSRSGDISILNQNGSIYSINGSSEISGENITLSALNGDIGDSIQAVRLNTIGGLLEAGANGIINLDETEGDLTIGSISTSGDAFITADGSILDNSAGSAVITAVDVTLVSENGGIGQGDNDLAIDSMGGILSAEALGDIYITETNGEMRVDRVASLQGDVVLTSDGAILDYNLPEDSDEDTLDALADVREDLDLENDARVQAAIDTYKQQKKEEYRDAHRISDNGTPYEASDDTYDSSYDPDWEYVLTEDEGAAFAESTWADEELINAKNILTMPDNEVSAEEANVSGRNVTLVSNANVGKYGGDEVINYEDIASGNITDYQKQLLVQAEKGEVSTDAQGNVVISLDKDFNVDATGNLTITAGDYVYLSSDHDINLEGISSGGDIELTSGGSILNSASAGGINLTGNNITLSASGGDIGGSDETVRINTMGGLLKADAAGIINIEEAEGDLTVESIIANGAASITADGSILDLSGESAGIIAGDITLISRNGGIGQGNNHLSIDSTDGMLAAEARDNIYITETDGAMNVDHITSSEGDITLNADGSILSSASGDMINLTGNNISISSNTGSIGDYGYRRLVADSNGIFNVDAHGDIYLEERVGDYVSDETLSGTGNIDILVPNGKANIKTLSALQDAILDIYGDVTINSVDSSSVNLHVSETGGSLLINNAIVSEGMHLNADNITILNAVYTGSEPPLHMDVTGGSNDMADTVDITISSLNSTIFDRLFAENATVNAAGGLSFLDALIGEKALFTSGRYSVVVDNAPKTIADADLQLYAKDRQFYLYFPEQGNNFKTNAFVVNYDDDFTVNGFGTENSITRLIPKLIYIIGYPEIGTGDYDIFNLAWLSSQGLEPATGIERMDSDLLNIKNKTIINDENDINIVRK